MNRERQAPPIMQGETGKSIPVRPYQPPELEEYGSLKELTRTFSNLTPGDGLGGSFAT